MLVNYTVNSWGLRWLAGCTLSWGLRWLAGCAVYWGLRLLAGCTLSWGLRWLAGCTPLLLPAACFHNATHEFSSVQHIVHKHPTPSQRTQNHDGFEVLLHDFNHMPCTSPSHP